ncbi:MAG TPA: sugar phosphate nucleotidyltransferase [Anaerolineales bacterium]
MAETLKVIIPMAGWGTRMRPHTWSKPKPLVGVAGRTALDYLMDMFKTVPRSLPMEFIFVLGPSLGERQIPPFIEQNYPELKAHYVVQAEMRGQSHALYLAREHLSGPMIMCFSDTLIETDLSFLDHEQSDGIAWVKAVPDPRRFGVAEIDAQGWVRRLIEKPQDMQNNLALVGCYYFRQAQDVIAAIEEQMQRDVRLKGEFFLADAINIMLELGARIRIQKTHTWLDTGTIDSTLETNRYLLERDGKAMLSENHPNGTSPLPGVKIVQPVFIHRTAEITDSQIGPYASIGANCRISGSVIEDSIIESDCEIVDIALKRSVVGRQAKVQGRGTREVLTLNISDDSSVIAG